MAQAEQKAAEPDSAEPLIVAPAGAEARVIAIIAPVLEELGFRPVRVRLSGLNGLTLQIMAERFDGSMTIQDCELLSRNISPLLDVEDVIDRQYNLEISSPGMDRPLARKSDFVTWSGHLAKIETHRLVEGRKKFRGLIKSVSADSVLVQLQAAAGEAAEAEIPFDAIAEANLVLTDELIRAALLRDKQAKMEENEAAAEPHEA